MNSLTWSSLLSIKISKSVWVRESEEVGGGGLEKRGATFLYIISICLAELICLLRTIMIDTISLHSQQE